MELAQRILLMCACVITFGYVVWKVRKSQVKIEDTIFWILFALFLLLLSLFPAVVLFISGVLGFDSPANLVFLVIIFLLLVKMFFMSVQISAMDNKIKEMVQEIALVEHKSRSNAELHPTVPEENNGK